MAHVIVLSDPVRIAWATFGEHGEAFSIGAAQLAADEALVRAGWTLQLHEDAVSKGASQ